MNINSYRVKQLIDKVEKLQVNNMTPEEIQKSFTKEEQDILKVAMTKVQKSEDNELEKGGEGSRGGKVIGHTKSGKPVYEKSQNLSYNGFTKQDHLDAAEHHGFEKRSAQDALENTKDFNKRKLLKEKINTHEENERGHITRSNNAKE